MPQDDWDKQDPNTWSKIRDNFVEAYLNKHASNGTNGVKINGHKIDYASVLVQASRSMIRFKKPEHLIKMIVRMLDEQIMVTHTAVLLFKERKNAYVLIDSRGVEGIKIPVGYIRLTVENPLIKVFSERKNYVLDESGALIYENVKKTLDDGMLMVKNHGLKDKLLQLKAEMERLRADLCIPSYFKRTLIGVLVLGKKMSGERFNREEVDFFITLANDTSMAISNARLIENLHDKVKEVAHAYEREKQLFINTTIAFAAAIDARDPYTHGHTERTTHYALAISGELPAQLKATARNNFEETLQVAALLHDIGKIGIPDYILNKDNVLTPRELGKIREHPTIGANILYPIKQLKEVVEVVRAHQEWYNGAGYPHGLSGENIPLIARVISVADAFDAMTTDRPYRQKNSIELAVEEVKAGSGTQFDPVIVEAFLRAYHKGTLFTNGTL